MECFHLARGREQMEGLKMFMLEGLRPNLNLSILQWSHLVSL